MSPVEHEPAADRMLDQAFQRMKRSQPCVPEMREPHDAVVGAVDSLGAVVVETRDGQRKTTEVVTSLDNSVRAWKAAQDEQFALIAKARSAPANDDDIDIHIPKSLWSKFTSLHPAAISAIVAGLLALGTGGIAGLRAFLNMGRATAATQAENRAPTKDESETILANVRQLIAEDRKATAAAEEERTARIVAAALEKTKAEYLARQTAAAQAEKDKKR